MKANHASAQGHKRWDKAVTTGLDNLCSLVHDGLVILEAESEPRVAASLVTLAILHSHEDIVLTGTHEEG